MKKKRMMVMVLLTLLASVAPAAVTVTNHDGSGGTFDVTTVAGFVTGNTPGAAGTTERFGFDVDEVFGQSFTLDEEIALGSIYHGYSGYKNASTVTLYIDAGNDATTLAECEYSFAGLVFDSGVVHDGSNDGPHSYVQFDVSGEAVTLAAGQHAYYFEMTAEDGTSWAWAPSRNNNDTYAGGVAITIGQIGGDQHFAVTGGPPRGPAHTPFPTGSVDKDTVANELTWLSGDVPDDPNLTVDSFDFVYYSKLTEDVTADDPNFVGVAPITGVTSPYALTLEYDTTYFWRVDSHVTWDSNEITGNLSEVIESPVWSFNTLAADIAPVATIPDTGDSLVSWLANLPENGLTGTVDDNGEGDLASVTWEIISGPGIPVAEAMQMLDRSGQIDNLLENYADPNLLRDWIGTDTRIGGSDVMTLVLSGLPAGTYNWTSYHHDASNQTGVFDVTVNDSTGSTTWNGIDISDTNEIATTLDLTIVSDGSDVTLVFDKNPNSILAEAFFIMNGFDLTGTGDPLKIDFTVKATDPDPDLVMTGYQGYIAEHEVPESFTAQGFSAFGTTVTVTPSWDYTAATVTDTTVDMASPTATFDVTATPYTTTGLYTIQLTVEDNAAQSDSDTLQIRVETDACAAAKRIPDFSLNYYDSDDDCDVDMVDFAAFAAQWLDDLNLTGTYIY